MAAAEPILVLKGIRHTFGGPFRLSLPNLQIVPGEILALVGPNGSGKSTLLAVAGLLLKPDEGEVSLLGQRGFVSRRRDIVLRRRLSVCLEKPYLLQSLNVRENVELPLKLTCVPKSERAARARRWLDYTGVLPLAGRPVAGLSTGEARRAGLARAFVTEPKLLILDEPFSSLDEPARLAFAAELKALLKPLGTAALFVTHDLREALVAADRIGVLTEGTLQVCAPALEILHDPALQASARRLGLDNTFYGWELTDGAHGRHIRLDNGAPPERLPVPAEGRRVLVTLTPLDQRPVPPEKTATSRKVP